MKRGYVFLICLLLSFSVWLIHNLSQPYSDVVSVPVVAVSNIEGRAQRSAGACNVVARCRATGFTLLQLRRSSRHRDKLIEIGAADFTHQQGDQFSIDAEDLHKYATQIFGESVSIESFASRSFLFRFTAENYRKVPIKPVSSVSFRPQYMPLSQMQFSPDSVVLYADPARLEGIERVLTRPIVHSDLRKSVHGMVKLEPIAGVRMSDEKVAYSLEVTRFVELSGQVKVELRNVPAGRHFSAYPSSVSVRLDCTFPMQENPLDAITLYVDYREFASSLTGRCVVHCDALPEGVLSMQIDPQVCDCVENVSER
ncbi:MAG: hypothetical protein IJU63_07240 [Bacteroidales bacterium]|nr:hypothetical protein [Bacteroidales bacterium]